MNHMLPDLKRFVFDGLLVKDGLQRLSSEEGISVDVITESSVVSRAEQMDFPIRLTSAAAQMASVFTLFFCVENSARELITQRLNEKYGASWWEKVPQKIREKVATLQASEELHRYHTPRSSELIGYTTFGQLEQIIIANWSDFEDIIPDQAWLKSRFSDMERSRNIIMHTGLLAQFEIDRLEMIGRDWTRQVG